MDFSWIWQTIMIFAFGTMILRIGGTKSISQMTISQVIVMLGIGTLLIQPVSGKGLAVTFLVASILILSLVVTEYLEIKVDFLETLISGKAVVVIENGKPNLKALKKLRLTIDRLETRLRQAGISSINDVQYATIEVNGQLGYELIENKKLLTKGDLQILLEEISQIKKAISNVTPVPAKTSSSPSNIFKEIQTKEFEGNSNEP